MNTSRNIILAIVASASLALSGCTGSGAALPSAPQQTSTSGGPTATRKGTIHIHVKIPKRFDHKYKKYVESRDPKTHRMHRVLSPEYVSVSTTSLEFQLVTVNGGAVPGGFTNPKFINLSSCTNSSGTYTCATAWVVPAAVDVFNVFACDGANCSGNQLSKNSITKTVTAGANSIAITLWGIPNSVIASETDPFITGTSPTFTIHSNSLHSNFWTLHALDADGNDIVSLDQFTSVSTSGAFIWGTGSGFSVNLTPQAATASLSGTVTMKIDTTTLGYPYTCLAANCQITISATTTAPPHSLVVPDTNGTSDTINVYAGSAVDAALDGVTGVSPTGSMTASCTSGMSRAFMDASSNFYVNCIQGAGNTATIDVWSAATVKTSATTSGVSNNGVLTCNAAHSPTGTKCGNGIGDLVSVYADNAGNVFATDATHALFIWSAANVATAFTGSSVQATGGVSSIGPNLGQITKIASTVMVMDATNNLNNACTSGPWAATYAKNAVITAALGGTFTGNMSGCMVNASGGIPGASQNDVLNIGGNAYFASSTGGGCTTICSGGTLLIQGYSNANITAWTNAGNGFTSSGSMGTGDTSPSYTFVGDAAGDLFIGDQNNLVQGYSATQAANALTGARTPSGGSWSQTNPVVGMDCDTTDDILFTSVGGNTVAMLNSAGVTSLAAGGTVTTTGTFSATGADVPWDF